jgi:geranylgeranyl reductase family protein
MNEFEVIIAGTGPAGATACYFLQQAGKRVLVIDKAKLPRYKPCGGGLSLDFLKEIFPFSFNEVIDQRIDLIHYHFNNFKQTIPCRPDVMAMVMRDKFDKLILDQAGCPIILEDAVIKVVENPSGVEVFLESGKNFSTDYLIAADGANSVIRRQSGLHRTQKLIAAIEAEVPITPALREKYADGPVFIFDKPRAGYSWIFPKKDFLSVGIGVLGKTPNIKGELVRIMNKYGISLEGLELHGHPIPIYDPEMILSTKRILLTGDAAGLADPFSGEGIRPAIKSGALAARMILENSVDNYTNAIFQQLGRRNNKSLFLWKIFLPLREVCLFLGAPNPFTTEAILELLSDRHSSLYVAGWSFITLWYYVPVAAIGKVIEWIGGRRARNAFLARLLPTVPNP